MQQLNIPPKTDNVEKQSQLQNVPENEYISAAEFNDVVDKVNEIVDGINEIDTDPELPEGGDENDVLTGTKTWRKAIKLTKTIAAAAYTLVAEDFYKKLVFTNACTITCPPNIGRDGLLTTLRQGGNGQITIVAGVNATVTKSDLDTNKSAAKGSMISIECYSASAYHICGQLELL